MASTVTTMVAEAFDHVSSILDAPFAKAFVLGVPVSGHLVVEAILLATVFLLLLQKSYKPPKRPLTEQEIDQLCNDWVPEPLHPPITNEMSYEPPVLESAAGPHTIVDGKDTLNFSSGNYLGLIGHTKLTECCTASLEKYGVGACGPRGFYGTIDTHLDCEAKIASFLGTPDSILYSYGVSATFSTIPAFCKRGDIIVADEGVNWGIRKGLHLSRSTVEFFKHNDMSSLETILQRVTKGNKQLKKLRRYIVVEGIYQNSGQIAPLDEIIRLKEKYLFRVLLEESNSFGVLGRSGRGLSEHFNVPVSKIDIITASMANSLATDGGFCTGSARVVDYQRLSSSGYVFSASLPPYLASAAITAIDLLVENPHLREKLRDNISLLWKGLSDIPELVIASNPLSPVIFLKLKNSSGSFKDDLKVLEMIIERMLKDECVLLASVRRSFLDRCALPAGLRLCVSAAHSEDDISKVTESLKRVVRSVIYNE